MQSQDLAKLIADAIFRRYQLGMGTTNHPVVIAVEEKPALTELIQKVLDANH